LLSVFVVPRIDKAFCIKSHEALRSPGKYYSPSLYVEPNNRRNLACTSP